jgi:hypothetical protein
LGCRRRRGAPQPLSEEVALDGVDEFLSTCCATTASGRTSTLPSTSTLQRATPGASRSTVPAHGPPVCPPPLPAGPDAAGASVRSTAGELVLSIYDPIPADSVQTDGAARLIDLVRAWDPQE